MRISGFGYGDDALEQGISQVKLSLNIASDIAQNMKDLRNKISFDVMVFTREEDYLCYVQAVALLYKDNQRVPCDFIYNKEVFRENIYSLDIQDDQFLVKGVKGQQHSYIIDNTDYPEVVLDPMYIVKPPTGDPNVDNQFIKVTTQMTYTSNDKYYAWTMVFVVVLGVLGILLLCSLICYMRYRCIYNRYTNERRELKLKLMQIRDHEYTNFLRKESLIIENMRSNSLRAR